MKLEDVQAITSGLQQKCEEARSAVRNKAYWDQWQKYQNNLKKRGLESAG